MERLTRMGARLLHTPMSGADLCGTDRNTPGAHPCSQYVIRENAPLIVPDVEADPRLRDDPAVREHETIAYAGYPLRSPDGEPVGAFFVADVVVRQWSADELADLLALAEAAEAAATETSLRIAYGEAQLALARQQWLLETTDDAYIALNTDGRISGWNAASEQLFGWSAAEATGQVTTELIVPPRFRNVHEQRLAEARRIGTSELVGQRLELAATDRAGREFQVEMTLQTELVHGQPVFHMFLHDISARIAMQTALEDERAFLQALLDSMEAGVVACDSKGKLAQLNQLLTKIHGLGVEPVEPEEWPATYYLFEADGQTLIRPRQDPLARAYRGEIVQHQDIAIVPPGRSPHILLTNARPIKTKDGRCLGAVAVHHDVTESRRAERLRRCRHAVANALSEAISAQEAGVTAVEAVAAEMQWACAQYWEVDEKRDRIIRIGSWARPGTDLAPFDGTDQLAFIRGESVPGMVWEHDHEIWTTDLLHGFADVGRLPLGHRLGLRTAFGVPVHMGHRVAGALAFFADTEIPRDDEILTMLQSIAGQIGRFMERRRAEDLTLALAAARRDFNRVVEQVNDCLWTVEMTPSGEVLSQYASAGGRGVFGGVIPTDSDMALTFGNLVHPDDRQLFELYHERALSGLPTEFEARVIGFDGITRWVWTRGTPRHEDGHLYIDGISTNVTERRELADQREQLLAQEQQQVHRLQELDRMKDELVAVVSHELRNPIAIIAAHTEVLMDEPDLAGQAELAAIERTIAHLVHLVDDLLDVARFDSGQANIDLRPLRLDRLLHRAVQEHQHGADAKPVTLVTEIDALPVVPGDAHRLRQVLDNLLSNAVKYTPPSGTITVTAHATDDTAVVRVTDTGIGIPADEYPKLFNRFFRASTATSRKIKGTGLGLTVVKAIVDAHGGTITAEPAPGGGTRFTLTLPR
ncbi:hypothetical protein GCM10010112_62860 [Actinoplanes lobatus]|uniref:histidine kinase n=1 Tax=Actinoplanes lobatus TaxID=113568 RepID=A0ABQ4ASU0_9ACTN|nr:hypothetical protein GCM10010112_62860 [Actinoplanes lobatus]GIE44064.1 hypothetical protein Alo02nite_69620 [Actinoplanes lobatus]